MSALTFRFPLFVTLVLLLLSLVDISAQDIIFTRDSTELKVRIIEKRPDKVRYKVFGEEGAEIQEIAKTNIFKIVYEAGGEERYDHFVEEEPVLPDSLINDSVVFPPYPLHLAGIDVLGLFMGTVGVRYEFIRAYGKTGIVIPFNARFSEKYYQSGISVNYYIYHSVPGKYKFGNINIGYAQLHVSAGPAVLLAFEDGSVPLEALLHGGLRFQFQKGFYLGMTTGFGLRAYLVDKGDQSDDSQRITSAWSFRSSAGWCFRGKEKAPDPKGGLY